MVLTFIHLLRSFSSLCCYSFRTVWQWSTLGCPSCVSGGMASFWHQRAGTIGSGYSGGRSFDRWLCFSTTLTWCRVWPSLTTRTLNKDCLLLDPRTSGSACGRYTMREPTLAEHLNSERIFGLLINSWLSSALMLVANNSAIAHRSDRLIRFCLTNNPNPEESSLTIMMTKEAADPYI